MSWSGTRSRCASSLVMIPLLLVLIALISPSCAADYMQVGVKVGDQASYTINDEWVSYQTGQTGFIYAEGEAEVRAVQGAFVDLHLTEWISGYSYGVPVGGNLTEGDSAYRFLVVAGLSEGDSLGLGMVGSMLRINETMTMSVAAADRAVNHLLAPNHWDGYLEVYWDKETGIMVKLNTHLGDFDLWRNFSMTSTTLWSAGLNLVIIVGVGGVAIAAIAVIVVVIHKRRG